MAWLAAEGLNQSRQKSQTDSDFPQLLSSFTPPPLFKGLFRCLLIIMEAQAQYCLRLEKYFGFRVSVYQHLIIIIINGRAYIYTNKLTYINQYNCMGIFICSIYTANSNGAADRRPSHLLFTLIKAAIPLPACWGKPWCQPKPFCRYWSCSAPAPGSHFERVKAGGMKDWEKLGLAAWGVLKSREPSMSTLAQG